MQLSFVRRSALAALVAVVGLAMASCAGEPAEGAAPPETAQVAPEDQGGADDADGDGGAFAEEELEGRLVSSFPADVPLYDGEVLSSLAVLSESADRPEWNATIGTGDAIDAVDASIRDAYSTGGWEIRTDMKLGAGAQLIAHSAAYIVSITYMDSGGVTINYGVSPK